MIELLMLLQDSTVVTPPTPDAAIVGFATLATGFLGSLLLGGIKKVAGPVSTKIMGADAAIAKAIKPAQPLLLMGLTYALPLLGAKIGVVPPEAAHVVNAPLAALLGVVAREGAMRLFGKKGT